VNHANRRRLERLEAHQALVADAAVGPDPRAALIGRLETLRSRLAMTGTLPEPPEIRRQREHEIVVNAARRQRAARAEVEAHVEGRWRPPWPMTAAQAAACYEGAVADLEGTSVHYRLVSSVFGVDVTEAASDERGSDDLD
jgi:hypothetical protein